MPDNEQRFTNPDLHRTIATSDMTGGKENRVFLAGTNSYRMIEISSGHSEESDNDEIP